METINQLAVLTAELDAIRRKIKSLEGIQDITDRIAASFYLGRVGGSGGNTHRLNKNGSMPLIKPSNGQKYLPASTNKNVFWKSK